MSYVVIVSLVVILIIILAASLSVVSNKDALIQQGKIVGIEAQGLQDEVDFLKAKDFDNEYFKRLSEKQKRELNELQETYNSLWGDASSCYWANYCLNNGLECEQVFSGDFVASSADELHEQYSLICDGMYRDWSRYQQADTFLTEDE